MYDYYLLHVLLLHNCAILARQRFARMSFSTQWALSFAIQEFSTLTIWNFQKNF